MSTGNHIADIPVNDRYFDEPVPEIASCNYCNYKFDVNVLERTYYKGRFTGYACENCINELKTENNGKRN